MTSLGEDLAILSRAEGSTSSPDGVTEDADYIPFQKAVAQTNRRTCPAFQNCNTVTIRSKLNQWHLLNRSHHFKQYIFSQSRSVWNLPALFCSDTEKVLYSKNGGLCHLGAMFISYLS